MVQILERIQEQIVDITGLVFPQFSSTAVEPFSPQVVGSLPPFQEFDAPAYDQIHQEHVVAGMATQHRVENSSVQEQVIIHEIPQVSIGERIQEQIVDIAVLVNPQFSNTAVEASAPQVVVSLLPIDEFTAPVYNQVHQEQIVARGNDPAQS